MGSGQGFNPTQVQFLTAQKLILERQVLVGKESLLYAGGRQPGEKVDLCPRSNYQLLIRGQELLKGGFGGVQVADVATCRTAQSTLTVISKLVMPWSDQGHLDYFKYS